MRVCKVMPYVDQSFPLGLYAGKCIQTKYQTRSVSTGGAKFLQPAVYDQRW